MQRWLMLMVLVFAAAGGANAEPFGQVRSFAGSGEISQEVGYFRYDADWDSDEEEAGFGDTRATQHQAYLQAGYALGTGWETYFRLGVADLDLEDLFDDPGESDFDGDYEPFGSLGLRGKLFSWSIFDLGVFAQGSYFGTFKDGRKFRVVDEQEPDLELRIDQRAELSDYLSGNAGLLVQANWRNAALYAGPFLYWRRGELEIKSTAELFDLSGDAPQPIGDPESEKVTTIYEEEGGVGAVVGLHIPLARYAALYVEGQVRSRFSAGGGAAYLRLTF